jgi:7-cyano-7-deazaguanine synthase in queuosine biosynthesis
MNEVDYKKIKGKTVLLFSGGMDCYCINQLEKPDVLLYIDNNSAYSKYEKTFLKQKQAEGFYENLVFVDNFIDMSTIERDDKIIPARNAYFILKAAEYGDTIILGATSGDRSTDKDITFAKQMEDILNHIYEASHWVGEEGRKITVDFRYKSFTKKQILEKFVMERTKTSGATYEEAKQIVSTELSTMTVSCYDFKKVDGETKPCGTCKPCTRKWLALLGSTGVDTGAYFATNPREYFNTDTIQSWIAKESGNNNRGPESKEIIDTLEKIRDGLI